MADEREQIRSRIDIIDLVSQRVKLKKSGKNWTGLCPFHEDKNPSFSVSPDIGRYKCWSCDAAGDVFTWVMETQGVEFREALEILAKQAGIELSQHEPGDRTRRQRMLDAMAKALHYFRDELKTAPGAKEYCEGRDLSQEILDEWEIGYAPNVGEALATELKKAGFKLSECKELFLVDGSEQNGYGDRFRGRLIFPIRDDQGHLVAFGGRIIGDGHPKYINSSDTPLFSKSRTLYGMNRARDSVRSLRQAVLVEGYLDVIACHRAGVTNAVATLGTAFSEQHTKRLALWCDEVVVLFDNDKAGQKAAQRTTEILSVAGIKVRVALMQPGQDPDTLLKEKGPEAVQNSVKSAIEPIEFLLKQISEQHDIEQSEYWDEIARALATLPTHLELERHLMPLAATYPFMRDPERAATALRAMVRKASIKMKADKARYEDRPSHEEPAPAKKERTALKMPPPIEAALFKALGPDDTREDAWILCKDNSLFITESGIRLSRTVIKSWPEDCPTGNATELLDQIAEEPVRDLIASLFMQEDAPMSNYGLQDVAERLRQRKAEIDFRSSVTESERTDEDLMRFDARLKELKGTPLVETATDDSADPFL